jgi:hypothetical protein
MHRAGLSQEGLKYRIAATVVDILPNGTLILEATKSSPTTPCGNTRSPDGSAQGVAGNNTVHSENVAPKDHQTRERQDPDSSNAASSPNCTTVPSFISISHVAAGFSWRSRDTPGQVFKAVLRVLLGAAPGVLHRARRSWPRLENICTISGQQEQRLIGLGLVTGLKGTGDGGKSAHDQCPRRALAASTTRPSPGRA